MPETPVATPTPAQQRWHQAGLAAKTSLAFRKKGITISLGGTDVPIFLLDDSAVVVKITPTTTAAAALIAVRDQVSNDTSSWLLSILSCYSRDDVVQEGSWIAHKYSWIHVLLLSRTLVLNLFM